MSKKCSSEERFPLLLLYLEDGQRSSKQNRKILIDKGRYESIVSGASSVMTQWPGHVTSCWVSASLIGISIILVSMLMLTFSLHPGIQILTTKCKMNSISSNNKSSIIHLVHGPGSWTKQQLDALEVIAQNNPLAQIKLNLIRNEIDPILTDNQIHYTYSPIENLSSIDTKIVGKRDVGSTTSEKAKITTATTPDENKSDRTVQQGLKKKTYKLNISVGTKKLLGLLLRKPFERMGMKRETRKKDRTVQDLLEIYPNIELINSTYEKIFRTSPLHFFWHNTNQETRLFAIRVLQLWNFGGIAFSLPDSEEPLYKNTKYYNPKLITPASENLTKYKEMVRVGTSTFKDLPLGLVTIDEEGARMETKTICHALFGELLMALTKANRSTMPVNVIKQTLNKFCLKGTVDANYCKTITS